MTIIIMYIRTNIHGYRLIKYLKKNNKKKCIYIYISMAANQNHVYPFFSKTLLFQFFVENTILHNL